MLIVVAVVCLVAAGCKAVLQTPAVSFSPIRRDQVRFEAETAVRVETYDVAAGDGPMELCVRIGLVAGTLEWQITNPLGQHARGQGEVTEETPCCATYCFEATPGTWRFEVDLKAASGQYEVAWRELGADPKAANYLLHFDEEKTK